MCRVLWFKETCMSRGVKACTVCSGTLAALDLPLAVLVIAALGARVQSHGGSVFACGRPVVKPDEDLWRHTFQRKYFGVAVVLRCRVFKNLLPPRGTLPPFACR